MRQIIGVSTGDRWIGGKEMLQIKDIIDSKYEVKEKLGEGLFRATEIRLMTPFIIKEIVYDDDVREILSILEELRKVNHRLFPKIVEIIKEENSVLIVMENVSGCCAAELIKEKRRPEIVISHALELCEGLEYFSSLSCSEKVSWRLSLKDVFMDGGRVCLQDFRIVQKKNLQKEQEDVIFYVKEMLGESLKKMKKLNRWLEEYLQGQNSYFEYNEIAEELERQLIEYNKSKKLNKLLIKTGVATAILGCFGFSIWKGISIVKQGADTQAASASTNTTKEPEKTNAIPTTPETKKIEKTASPKVTMKISTLKPTDVPTKKKTAVTSKPDTETVVRTKAPIVTRKPAVISKPKKKIKVTQKPKISKPKKPKVPQNVEIELENNDMEITVE